MTKEGVKFKPRYYKDYYLLSGAIQIDNTANFIISNNRVVYHMSYPRKELDRYRHGNPRPSLFEVVVDEFLEQMC